MHVLDLVSPFLAFVVILPVARQHWHCRRHAATATFWRARRSLPPFRCSSIPATVLPALARHACLCLGPAERMRAVWNEIFGCRGIHVALGNRAVDVHLVRGEQRPRYVYLTRQSKSSRGPSKSPRGSQSPRGALQSP